MASAEIQGCSEGQTLHQCLDHRRGKLGNKKGAKTLIFALSMFHYIESSEWQEELLGPVLKLLLIQIGIEDLSDGKLQKFLLHGAIP